MTYILNPFIVTGEIPDRYFCDRKKEAQWLTTYITNGTNIVLMAPRRIGKTSLVEHCYQKPEIKDKYHTFYIDILPTTSLAEFTYLLGRKIYETLLPKGRKIINKFLSSLASIRGALGYDAMSGMPTFTISAASMPDPMLTLDEIFRYLSDADKPCIVTIDEFQQIAKYPEKNVEALLRSHIQKLKNCNFIFAGSEQHMMMQMFGDENRPFYNSATMMDLRAIPIDVYADFVVYNFQEFGKSITSDDARSIYNVFEGNTFYIQSLCHTCFINTPKGGCCDKTIIDGSLNQLLEINQTFFREKLSLVSPKLKPLLYAIAKAGTSESIFSADFIVHNGLSTASAVQNAARQLLDYGLITKSEGAYSISDKLLALWIRRYIL